MGITTERKPPIYSIDITQTWLHSALIQDDQTALAQDRSALSDEIDVLAQLVAQLQRCHELLLSHNVAVIGMSLEGLVDGRAILQAQGSLRQLQDQPLQRTLAEQTGLPVVLSNRVNAMAYCEATLGSGKGAASVFYIHADEQLGAAFYSDSGLWQGQHHSAGQIGYLVADWMATKPITLAQRASGLGLVHDYNMRSRNFRVPHLRDVLEFAERDDQLAARVIRDGAHILGSVLGAAIGLFDPQAVIVGGQLSRSDDLWWPVFAESFYRALLPTQQELALLPAHFDSTTAALIGAALAAR